MPKVSVIMPVYNGEKFLAEAIESVLNQTYSDLELIVVNDGSTDRSQEIIESFRDARLRCVVQEKAGPAAARNRGIEVSRGSLITFLDCDDVYLDTAIEDRVKFLEKDTKSVFVHTDSILIDENGAKITDSLWRSRNLKPISGRCFKELFLNGTFLNTCSVMVRREIFDDVGIFDESFSSAEDYELWLRIAYHYWIDFLDKPLVKYRLRTDSLTKHKTLGELHSARALLKVVAAFPDVNRLVGTREMRNRLYSQCFDVAYNYLRQGDAKAARYWLRKAWYWGRKPKTLVQLIATWCGPLMRRYQAQKEV